MRMTTPSMMLAAMAAVFFMSEVHAQTSYQDNSGTVHVNGERSSDEVHISGGQPGYLAIDFLSNGTGIDYEFRRVTALIVQSGQGLDIIEIDGIEIDSLTIDSGLGRPRNGICDNISVRNSAITGLLSIDANGTQSGNIVMSNVTATEIQVGNCDAPRYFNMIQVQAGIVDITCSGDNIAGQSFNYNYVSTLNSLIGSFDFASTGSIQNKVHLTGTDVVSVNCRSEGGRADVQIMNAITNMISVVGSSGDDQIKLSGISADSVELRLEGNDGLSNGLGDVVVVEDADFGDFAMEDDKYSTPGNFTHVDFDNVNVEGDCTFITNDELTHIYLTHVYMPHANSRLRVASSGIGCRLDRVRGSVNHVHFSGSGLDDSYWRHVGTTGSERLNGIEMSYFY